jgi:hypothetical protein
MFWRVVQSDRKLTPAIKSINCASRPVNRVSIPSHELSRVRRSPPKNKPQARVVGIHPAITHARAVEGHLTDAYEDNPEIGAYVERLKGVQRPLDEALAQAKQVRQQFEAALARYLTAPFFVETSPRRAAA